MKNNIISRILAAAMTAALIVSTVPITVSAATDDIDVFDVESNEEITAEADEKEVIEITQQLSSNLYDSNYYDGYSYSSLLDQNNITVYNSLASLADPNENPIMVDLPDEVRVNLGSKDPNEPLTEGEKDVISQHIATSIYSGYGFLLLDHPEIFWTAPTFTFSYTGTYEVNNLTNETVFKVKNITFYFQLDEDFGGDIDYARRCKDQLFREIGEFQVDGSTRYEKVKNIHDRLIQTISYNKDAPFSHSVIGSLIYGESVCEGYSEAFKLICDREGIPCISVVNGSHMWNQVKMDDGNWYAIDATWDDRDFVEEITGSDVSYDYFLKGMNSFLISHFPISSLYGVSYKTPNLCRKDYDCDPQPPAPIQKDQNNNNDDIANLGTPEQKADLDGDGVVSIADAVICTATVLSFESDTECDINNDGVTNAFDIIALKRIIKRGRKES